MLDLSKIDFLAEAANTSIESDVCGKPKKFYPLSQRRVNSFRGLAAKIASAVRDMLYDYSKESGAQSERNTQTQVGSDFLQSTVLPLNPALSEAHRKFRMSSMEQLVNAMDDAAIEAMALCILDSMRDDFPRDKDKPFTLADSKKLVDDIPFPAFVQCAMGVYKANIDSFGPFAKRAGGKVLKVLEDAMETMEPTTTSSNSES